MSDGEFSDVSEDFDKASTNNNDEFYLLKLFVAGQTVKSANAIKVLKLVLNQYLYGRYQLDVIDISQQPEMARQEQVVATPTLVKRLPIPVRRVIGDLQDTERILVALNIAKKKN